MGKLYFLGLLALQVTATVAIIRAMIGYRVPHSWAPATLCHASVLFAIYLTPWALVLFVIGILLMRAAVVGAARQFRSEAISPEDLGNPETDLMFRLSKRDVKEKLPLLPTDVRVLLLIPQAPRPEALAQAAGFHRVWVLMTPSSSTPIPVWVREPTPQLPR